jgi:hypothetical protein
LSKPVLKRLNGRKGRANEEIKMINLGGLGPTTETIAWSIGELFESAQKNILLPDVNQEGHLARPLHATCRTGQRGGKGPVSCARPTCCKCATIILEGWF